jgi:hypothetical protein
VGKKIPRVLFCTSEIPQSVNAGSMQLFRALQGYPGDHLMVLGVAPERGAQLLPCRYELLQLLTYRLACTRFRAWTTGLNALNTLVEPQIGRSMRLAREFGPDLVVTVMDKLSYYKHAWALARHLGVPMMTITMDDPQTFEVAHPWFEGGFVRFLHRMYSDVTLSLGVSREMCDDLAARFGKPSTVFYFGPPEGIQPRPPEDSGRLKSPPRLTLGYAGSLSLGYRDGLLSILPALAATKTKLNLYTRDQHCLIEHPQIVNRGFHAPDKLWPLVQAECDVVLQPYAFDGAMDRVYRTHFPTKLSEYCWAGMPILVTGPAFATGVGWAGRHPDAAQASTSPAPEVLGPVLERIRTDSGLRETMARGAATAAREEFDPVLIRQTFVHLLRLAAGQAGQPGKVAV